MPHISDAKPFTKQKGSDRSKTVKVFEDAFESSGNDFRNAFQFFVLHTHVGRQYRYQVTESMRKAFQEKMSKSERNLHTILSALFNVINDGNEQDKLKFLSILSRAFSKNELHQRGLEVPKELWDKARKLPRAANGQEQQHDHFGHFLDASELHHDLLPVSENNEDMEQEERLYEQNHDHIEDHIEEEEDIAEPGQGEMFDIPVAEEESILRGLKRTHEESLHHQSIQATNHTAHHSQQQEHQQQEDQQHDQDHLKGEVARVSTQDIEATSQEEEEFSDKEGPSKRKRRKLE